MRLGILADIHESIEPLRRALAALRERGVDRVVTLGDACDNFSPVGRSAEVVDLLRGAGAVGVWGNHDIGLCVDVAEKVRRATGPGVLEYMATMRPHLVVESCHFSHVEPWLDATRVEDLWYFDGPPATPAQAARSFAAVPQRHLFIGHFHRWLAVTPSGPLPWDGAAPLDLAAAPRSLVVVAPVFNGWCAVFDTVESRLTPVRVGDFGRGRD
jgi:hypothetical protein